MRTKATFGPALEKLRQALADREHGGTILDAMAERIRQRAEKDPTLLRGETFEELTQAPQDTD